MDKYLNHLARNGYSTNTISTYKSVLQIYRNHLKDIRNVKAILKSKFNSPNTVWTHYNVLVSYFEFINDKRIKQLKEIKLPRVPMKFLNVFKKQYLFIKTNISPNDSSETINKKMLIRFLFETGIRVSEIKSIISYNKKTMVIKGKGNKIREIFHNYDTTSLISDFNFTSKTIRIYVKEVLGKKYTPHSIRRSFATHLLLRGANPKMVMLQLGHSKVETTFRYLQLSLEQNKKIYDKYF
ncbi:MAG: tyrosine-type recombinase/integrase [Lactobacillaceae bacterium]|jgi:integrase/recombinase XerD|nr:tyrosine-type recombinase/integrase [Lactobacillaceae bacterium]